MPNVILDVLPNPFRSNGTTLADFAPHVEEGQYKRQGRESTEGDKLAEYSKWESTTVVRPISGFDIKPNTHATIQIIDSSGHIIKVFNRLGKPQNPLYGGSYEDKVLQASKLHRGEMGFGHYDRNVKGSWAGENLNAGISDTGEPTSTVWTDFILQSVREERSEKTQLVETFGDNYLYSYGQKPRVLAFNGILMNTADMQWKAVFWENWDQFFRASKLQSRNARMYITYDDVIVEGYPIQAVAQQTADSPYAMVFSFSFFVTNYINTTARNQFHNARRSKTSLSTVQSGFDSQNMKWAKHRYFGASHVTEWLTGGILGGVVGSLAQEKLLAWADGGTNSLGDRNLRLITAFANRTITRAIRGVQNSLWTGLTYGTDSTSMKNLWKGVGATMLQDVFTYVGDVYNLNMGEDPDIGFFLGDVNKLLGFAGDLMQLTAKNVMQQEGGSWGQNGIKDLGNAYTLGQLFNLGYENMAVVMSQHALGLDSISTRADEVDTYADIALAQMGALTLANAGYKASNYTGMSKSQVEAQVAVNTSYKDAGFTGAYTDQGVPIPPDTDEDE